MFGNGRFRSAEIIQKTIAAKVTVPMKGTVSTAQVGINAISPRNFVAPQPICDILSTKLPLR